MFFCNFWNSVEYWFELAIFKIRVHRTEVARAPQASRVFGVARETASTDGTGTDVHGFAFLILNPRGGSLGPLQSLLSAIVSIPLSSPRCSPMPHTDLLLRGWDWCDGIRGKTPCTLLLPRDQETKSQESRAQDKRYVATGPRNLHEEFDRNSILMGPGARCSSSQKKRHVPLSPLFHLHFLISSRQAAGTFRTFSFIFSDFPIFLVKTQWLLCLWHPL